MARREELDRIYSLAYEKLRRMARAITGPGDRNMIGPSTLLHETYIKFERSPHLPLPNELEFGSLAAEAMRKILLDAVRRRNAQKRGGDIIFVPFEDSHDARCEREFIELDEALEKLARLNPRQAQVVELRTFGGFTAEECAAYLGISVETVGRDYRKALAALATLLRKGAA